MCLELFYLLLKTNFFKMPYNVERVLLMASKMSTDRVKKIMTDFESNPNGTKIPEDILSSIQAHVVGMYLLIVPTAL